MGCARSAAQVVLSSRRPNRSSTSSCQVDCRNWRASTSSRKHRRKSAASFDRSPRRCPASTSANIFLDLPSGANSGPWCGRLTHGSNDHSAGHHIMLTGRSDLPPGFRSQSTPKPGDWPSIAAVAGALTAPRHNLPPAVVLPETLDPQHGADHSRPVRGSDGTAQRPLVHRGIALRPDRLRGLPGVRVRPPGSPQSSRQARSDSRLRAWACPKASHAARLSRGECRFLMTLDRQRATLDGLAARIETVRPASTGCALAVDRS